MLKFIRNNRAATAIEFALIAPIFFLLFIGIIEFGLTMFMNSSLQTGIRAYARNGITQGQTYDQLNQMMEGYTGGVYNPKKMSLLIFNAGTSYSNLTPIKTSFFADPDGSFDNQTSGGTFDNRNPPALTTYCASNAILLYGIRYDWGGITNLLSPFIPKELYAFTIVRNETYTVCPGS